MSSGDGEERRPADVRDLQGLLRLAVSQVEEGGGGAPAAAPMDEERRRFLEEALAGLTTDLIATLRAALQQLTEADESQSDQQLAALNTLRDHADQVDVANDLVKLGALPIVSRTLETASSGQVRAQAAGLIADLVQNNPYCQQAVNASPEVLPLLLSTVREEQEDPAARVTALQAVSGQLRDNPDGQRAFSQADGWAALLAAMRSDQPRLQTKAAFMLGSVCSQSGELRQAALSVGLVDQLCVLLQAPHADWHEHVLSALATLAADSAQAAAECRRPELRLADQLAVRENQLAGLEEARETLENCRTLRQLCFSCAEEDGER